jgi:plasmid maintenance system antidote protein VapI
MSPADLRAAIARRPREERQLYKIAAAIDLNPQRLSQMLNERIPMPAAVAQRVLEALGRAKGQTPG